MTCLRLPDKHSGCALVSSILGSSLQLVLRALMNRKYKLGVSWGVVDKIG